MKKIWAIMVVLGLLATLAGSVVADVTTPAEAQAAIPKLQAYIASVEAKLAAEKAKATPARIAKLQQTITEQKARLANLQKLAATPAPAPVVQAAVQPTPPPPPPVVKPKPVVKVKSVPLYEIGGNVGLVAGAFAVNGELTVQMPFVKDWFGLGGVWGRIAGGYVAGNNSAGTDTKMVPVYVDGAIDLPVAWTAGIPTYVGGGLNYVVYRTGQASGTVGGELFAGIEGDPFSIGGKTYLELGYGILRPSNGGSFQSVNALVGYRYGL